MPARLPTGSRGFITAMITIAGYEPRRLLFLYRHREDERYRLSWNLASERLQWIGRMYGTLALLAIAGGVALEAFSRSAERKIEQVQRAMERPFPAPDEARLRAMIPRETVEPTPPPPPTRD
ncbi:MAG: hypothetical protein HYY93_01680 [Planctomycetes bacterium]|nr:hypothetical protein [Planctomycetota bacterium]